MGSKTTVKLTEFIDKLVAEGEQAASTSEVNNDGELDPACDYSVVATWSAKCRQLIQLLGDKGKPFKDDVWLHSGSYGLRSVRRAVSTLVAVRELIENGLLMDIEDFAKAEVIGDLIDQAEYLLGENYHVAAGVLARGSLESHLRSMCDHLGCTPTKTRPTINDYNAALYAGKHLTKVTMKHVDALAAVGNEAAHASPDLKSEDVETMVPGVRDFVSRYSLSELT